jgi:hypothetical protein
METLWTPEKQREATRRYKQAHPEKVRAQKRRYWQRTRGRVLAHYGAVCACCVTTEELQIDHIDPAEGLAHRRAEIRGNTLILWLIANDFPPGYQTLCGPCNRSKFRGTHCRRHPLAQEVSADIQQLTAGECRSLLLAMAQDSPRRLATVLAMWRKRGTP